MELPKRYRSRVVSIRSLSSTGYELTLERSDLEFLAGRLVMLHGRHPTEDRSYTICSGEHDEHLQILFRYIPHGRLTPRLITLNQGDEVEWSGPYGEFVVREPAKPMVFVATGTGIAPCRSYVRSHKGLDLTLVHGVRTDEDLFYQSEFDSYSYHPFISQDGINGKRGRVTDFFQETEIKTDCDYYLCGANEMIFDVHALLRGRGVDDASVFTEAYYYR